LSCEERKKKFEKKYNKIRKEKRKKEAHTNRRINNDWKGKGK